MQKECRLQGIPYEAQRAFPIDYKGEPLEHEYRADLVCFAKIIVELKAVKNLTDEHRPQLMNYLKASKMRLGLLINMGHHPGVEIERIIL